MGRLDAVGGGHAPDRRSRGPRDSAGTGGRSASASKPAYVSRSASWSGAAPRGSRIAPQRRGQAGLPVDERAVAVEREGVEPPEVEGVGHRRSCRIEVGARQRRRQAVIRRPAGSNQTRPGPRGCRSRLSAFRPLARRPDRRPAAKRFGYLAMSAPFAAVARTIQTRRHLDRRGVAAQPPPSDASTDRGPDIAESVPRLNNDQGPSLRRDPTSMECLGSFGLVRAPAQHIGPSLMRGQAALLASQDDLRRAPRRPGEST